MLLDYPAAWLAVGLVSVLLGVAGLNGGFADRPKEPLPTASVNAAFDASPWRITIHAVRLFDDLPPLKLQNDGDRWLAVVATIENTSKESMSLFTSAIWVQGVEGLLTQKVSEVRYASTGGFVVLLHPNVPERVGYFWEQAANAPIPQTADVGLFGATYHDFARGENVYGWIPNLSGPPLAYLKIPVEDRREKK
jgi:hypothetical protein